MRLAILFTLSAISLSVLSPLANADDVRTLEGGYGNSWRYMITQADGCHTGKGQVNCNPSPIFRDQSSYIANPGLMTCTKDTQGSCSAMVNYTLTNPLSNDLYQFLLSGEGQNQTEIQRLAICVPGTDMLPESHGKISDSERDANRNKRTAVGELCNSNKYSMYGLNDYSIYQAQMHGVYKPNGAFNLDSLLQDGLFQQVSYVATPRQPGNPMAGYIQTPIQPQALDFISYITNTYVKPRAPSAWSATTKLDKNKLLKLIGGQAFRNYSIALRSYVAKISALRSVFLSMYADRLPTIDISSRHDVQEIPHVSKNGHAMTSPRALADYTNTYRANTDNNDWRHKMEQATPVSIAREQAYLMSAILAELNAIHHAVERNTATLATLQAANLSQELNEVQNKADQIKDPGDSE